MPRMRIAAAAALLLCGCAGRIRPEPTSPDHGLLVVRAKVRGALIPFFWDRADSAVVDQVDQDGARIPGKAAVAGVRGEDGAAAFLDLPPGRYALREITFKARGVRYAAAVPPAVAVKSAATLRPGGAAFLGELVLDGRYPEFDTAVERALAVLRHWLFPWSWRRRPVLPRDADLRVFEQGPAAEARALRDVRAALEGSTWRRVIDARLRELSAPEPPKREGLLGRELPLREEEFLSWRDTLKWGEPERASQGLVWRKPKSSARAAIFFTSATAKGFAGWEAAVSELRNSARSTEDAGGLYEVRVGTATGTAARATSYRYPESKLLGSEVAVIVTETVLVPWPTGMYTVRLRAEKDEFPKVLPEFREFLRQLVLGVPQKAKAQAEPELPIFR